MDTTYIADGQGMYRSIPCQFRVTSPSLVLYALNVRGWTPGVLGDGRFLEQASYVKVRKNQEKMVRDLAGNTRIRNLILTSSVPVGAAGENGVGVRG
jgi:hypothetical protein